jgi:hypothetical protein
LLAQQFGNAEIILIEPSMYMMPYAKARLSTSNIRFHECGVEEALVDLPNQDIVIFQRSLYALSGNTEYYKKLSNKLATKITENGIIGIFEIGQLYDIPSMHEYFQANRKVLRLSEEEFVQQWPIFEQALRDFNHGVASGDYMLFNKDNLDDIFSNNFALIDGDGRNLFIYCKK